MRRIFGFTTNSDFSLTESMFLRGPDIAKEICDNFSLLQTTDFSLKILQNLFLNFSLESRLTFLESKCSMTQCQSVEKSVVLYVVEDGRGWERKGGRCVFKGLKDPSSSKSPSSTRPPPPPPSLTIIIARC